MTDWFAAGAPSYQATSVSPSLSQLARLTGGGRLAGSARPGGVGSGRTGGTARLATRDGVGGGAGVASTTKDPVVVVDEIRRAWSRKPR